MYDPQYNVYSVYDSQNQQSDYYRTNSIEKLYCFIITEQTVLRKLDSCGQLPSKFINPQNKI